MLIRSRFLSMVLGLSCAYLLFFLLVITTHNTSIPNSDNASSEKYSKYRFINRMRSEWKALKASTMFFFRRSVRRAGLTVSRFRGGDRSGNDSTWGEYSDDVVSTRKRVFNAYVDSQVERLGKLT